MGMGWTSSENLVCILEEGTMAVYTIHGHLLYTRLISRVYTAKPILFVCVI